MTVVQCYSCAVTAAMQTKEGMLAVCHLNAMIGKEVVESPVNESTAMDLICTVPKSSQFVFILHCSLFGTERSIK